MSVNMDDDALIATVDLIGRTGAKGFEIGYLHEGVPVEEAGWYAHAQYRGARITEENHRGPVEAAEALARQLLTGAMCNHCKKLVALSTTVPRPSTARCSTAPGGPSSRPAPPDSADGGASARAGYAAANAPRHRPGRRAGLVE